MQAALLVATIASALVNWWSRWRDHERAEQWSKPLTTVLVIGLALVSGAPTSQITAAVVALSLCLLGDIALLPVVDRFVLGLAAFLLGHVAFIWLFTEYGLSSAALAGVAVIAAAALVATIGNVVVQGAAHADRALKWPVVAYLLVICTMAAIGWSTAMPWVIAGCTLFVVSDTILGWNQFVGQRRWMGPAVMITYHGAIVSLALSLW